MGLCAGPISSRQLCRPDTSVERGRRAKAGHSHEDYRTRLMQTDSAPMQLRDFLLRKHLAPGRKWPERPLPGEMFMVGSCTPATRPTGALQRANAAGWCSSSGRSRMGRSRCRPWASRTRKASTQLGKWRPTFAITSHGVPFPHARMQDTTPPTLSARSRTVALVCRRCDSDRQAGAMVE